VAAASTSDTSKKGWIRDTTPVEIPVIIHGNAIDSLKKMEHV
jgi:hypothetical protein